ncbi:MAG: molybdenum cofactor biosynthesis protein MoaE, partial [Opitutales bacterium]|nr:molybdenum cofactor biosynthesis protein MoaE [Opitutales bacterium]
GAYVSFEGWVRNHNEGTPGQALEYSAYKVLAVKEGDRIIAEALDRFEIAGAAAIHRIGLLDIGDVAVWVGASSAHRGPAFDGCRYIIDEIKDRVPIWKRESYEHGPDQWVNCAKGSLA